MRKLGFGFVGLVALAALAFAVAWLLGERALAATVELPTVRVMDIPTDADALARGEHIARSISGCAGCHTSDLGGDAAFLTSPGLIPAPNLTPAGVGGTYTAQDWVRALRTGIAKDGRRMLIMPSQGYAAMTDEDMGALIAFLTSVDPVARDIPPRDGRVLASVFVGIGGFPTADELAAGVAIIDAPEGVNIEYGRYLATIGDCAGCHGPNLAGNPGPGGEPGVNITPGGDIDEWTAAEFLTMFRTGLRPDGSTVPIMPIEGEYDRLTDDEVEAIRLYLLSLPELEDEGPR